MLENGVVRRTVTVYHKQIQAQRIPMFVQVRKFLPVRSERHGTINVVQHQPRCAAQNRRTVYRVDLLLRFIAAHEINVVSVRRKRQPRIARRDRRHDLGITPRGNVAQPQRLRAVLLHHVQQVLAVRRERRTRDFSVVRKILDGNLFEGHVVRPLQQRVNAESRRQQHQQGNRQE